MLLGTATRRQIGGLLPCNVIFSSCTCAGWTGFGRLGDFFPSVIVGFFGISGSFFELLLLGLLRKTRVILDFRFAIYDFIFQTTDY
jgi:hypothetical protein